MNITLLDNFIWNALNGYHKHLAIWGKIAARYQPETLPLGAMPEYNSSGFDDLSSLVEPGEMIAIGGSFINELSGWEIKQRIPFLQMVCDDLKPAPQTDIMQLTPDDLPEMQSLVDVAQPGPFSPRAFEMGQYYGIRQAGKLVAMAGTRFRFDGYCEVSTVCTYPEYRGRGYAGALTTKASEMILARNETPFLSVVTGNETAIRLYQKLGFRLHQELQFTILVRLA
jgi:ribosomal protein S18 acetylase RimI-like enzyme